MSDVDRGPHFDGFVRDRVESGRFRSASDVVREGLRLLEDRESALAEHRVVLRRDIEAAFEDPGPRRPAREVFARLRAYHAERVKDDERGG